MMGRGIERGLCRRSAPRLREGPAAGSLRVRRRPPRAVAATAPSASVSGVLEEADGIAVDVLDGDDQSAAADVADLPLRLPAGVQEHLQAAL